MTYILNIETATTNCSVSLAKDGMQVAIREDRSPEYSHSELLHQYIQEVMDEAQVSFGALGAIAVSKGPGSYTGLRIGVSAAKGLCFSLNIPLIAIATLEGMAYQVQEAFTYCIPMLDARRMEVYASVYDATYTEVRATKAEIITEEAFSSWASKGKVILAGSGAEKCKALIQHPNVHYNTALMPSATALAALSYAKYTNDNFEDVAYFEPYYLKDFIVQQKAQK